MLCMLIGIVAFVIPLGTTALGARYFAMMLFPSVASKSPFTFSSTIITL